MTIQGQDPELEELDLENGEEPRFPALGKIRPMSCHEYRKSSTAALLGYSAGIPISRQVQELWSVFRPHCPSGSVLQGPLLRKTQLQSPKMPLYPPSCSPRSRQSSPTSTSSMPTWKPRVLGERADGQDGEEMGFCAALKGSGASSSKVSANWAEFEEA